MADKFPVIIALVTVLFLFTVVASREVLAEEQPRTKDEDSANDQLHGLQVNLDNECRLRIAGSQHISCKSRWHDIRLPCSIRGTFALSADEIRDLLPDMKVSIGQEWEPQAKLSNALAKRLFTSLKVTAADEEAYAHWTGTGFQPNPVEVNSRITGVLRSVEGKGNGRVASIRLAGEAQVVESGKVDGRYGPNWWKSDWRLKIQVDLAISLPEGQLNALRLSAEGAIVGAYFNSAELREPFTAEVDFQASLPKPLSPRQIARIETLIKSLGDDRFVERERASNELLKLGSDAASHLRKAAHKARDAEVLYRLRWLANELAK